MIPEEVFKRRHFGTPQSFFLITVNYVVMLLAVQLFALDTISSNFWIITGLLGIYNIYKIRHDREEYDKIRIIAYIISIAGIVLMFFAFRMGVHHH